MAITSAIGLDISVATTDAYAPLGAKVIDADENGENEYIYVKNSTGAAWTVGQAVMRVAGESRYLCTVASTSVNPARVVGVAQIAVPAGSHAFVLRSGLGQILADGGVTANTGVVISAGTAGSFVDAAAVTDVSVGLALATDAGATLVAAHVNCVG